MLAHAQGSPPPDAERLNAAAEAISAILRRWAAAASRKAEAELPQRLNLWQAYLEEARESSASAGEYARQVRNRVIAGQLLHVTDTVASDPARRLESLDHLLHSVFRAGEFVWEAALAAVYPRREFWFLYGSIRLPPT